MKIASDYSERDTSIYHLLSILTYIKEFKLQEVVYSELRIFSNRVSKELTLNFIDRFQTQLNREEIVGESRSDSKADAKSDAAADESGTKKKASLAESLSAWMTKTGDSVVKKFQKSEAEESETLKKIRKFLEKGVNGWLSVKDFLDIKDVIQKTLQKKYEKRRITNVDFDPDTPQAAHYLLYKAFLDSLRHIDKDTQQFTTSDILSWVVNLSKNLNVIAVKLIENENRAAEGNKVASRLG